MVVGHGMCTLCCIRTHVQWMAPHIQGALLCHCGVAEQAYPQSFAGLQLISSGWLLSCYTAITGHLGLLALKRAAGAVTAMSSWRLYRFACYLIVAFARLQEMLDCWRVSGAVAPINVAFAFEGEEENGSLGFQVGLGCN
eukprot:GHRR01034744.1.p1 GENE.GHRR01034744.1~~GHRR01034744.1.p1  ORF type:complete len:140 (-),score=28.02 GHRR01034744.1:239-658(-)